MVLTFLAMCAIMESYPSSRGHTLSRVFEKVFMKKIILKILPAFLLIFSTFLTPLNTYAEPGDEANTEETQDENTEEGSEGEEEKEEEKEPKDICAEKTGSLSWIVCPSTGLIATITDELYVAIEDLLVVQPLPVSNALTSDDESSSGDKPVLGTTMNTSPIYLVWQYARNITNIIFIIFLIITIYSQLTGAGINNYGLKRILPRLIITVIMVNLSYIICALAVDVSNIIGGSLRDFFTEVENNIIAGSADTAAFQDISLDGVLSTVLTGGSIGLIAMSAVGGPGYVFFMLLVVVIGAIVAVASGLITIAARQALVSLLVMIAPLAFVAYLLPNTEKWFTQWRQLFTRMLVFYPLFSFLFGASHLLGFALLASATSPAGIILGIAVQIFPLFFSWGLMKMSGTILGNLNAGIRKLAAPLQRGATGWALSHAEQRRQNYIANSPTTGAHLRRYLDTRQKARMLDTENSAKIREGLATERALQINTSWLGLDEDGNAIYSRNPNRYIQNAKRASIMETRVTTAMADHKSTLSAYGHHFKDHINTNAINRDTARAVEAAMVQSYRAKNEAQADEDMMLDTYLKAVAQGPGSYDYNRLVKNAGGSLGAKGEASVMGQVIVANSMTENRRRTEARIVFTKFPIYKPDFRGFLLDTAHVNDDGFETDEYGNVLEDEYHHLKPGAKHQQWQYYIGRSKVDGHEITKDEYDRLSDAERATYTRVKYIDIKDALTGKTVQRVYDDDAGYMKELLSDDILIGDPLNTDRYMALIGSGDESHAPGQLYKYHSTISTNMNTSGYKVHDATMTPMVTAQANMGYINSLPHLNLARLQSYNVATKPGPFFQNDAHHIDSLLRCIQAFSDDTIFSNMFPDEEIMTYKNVNGNKLKGLKRGTLYDDEGNPFEGWIEVGLQKIAEMLDDGDDEEVLQYRKNYIRHNILAKAVKKTIGFANRNLTPNILESQKPDGLKALKKFVDTATDLALANEDASLDPDMRLDDNAHLLDSTDPTILKRKVNAVIDEALARYGDDVAPTAAELKTSKSKRSNSSQQSRQQIGGNRLRTRIANAANSQDLDEINQSIAALEALRDELESYNSTTDSENIAETIMGWADCLSLSQLSDAAMGLFTETPSLQHLTLQLQQTTEAYLHPQRSSIEEIIEDAGYDRDKDPKLITKLRDDIINLINMRAD